MKGTIVASIVATAAAVSFSSASLLPIPPPPSMGYSSSLSLSSSSSSSSSSVTNVGVSVSSKDGEKFAPRFDGLRFIETLVTAHRVRGKTGSKVYGPKAGEDYKDNQLRFSLLCLAALEAPRILNLNINKYFYGPYGSSQEMRTIATRVGCCWQRGSHRRGRDCSSCQRKCYHPLRYTMSMYF